MGAALKFKQTSVPRQSGEVARLRVLEGPDQGVTFVFRGQSLKIGRGEENDIVISDLKASRTHVQLQLQDGEWTVNDLGSANGIWINDQPFRTGRLKNTDLLRLGETTFEFISGESSVASIVRPAKSISEIQAQKKASEEHLKRIHTFGKPVMSSESRSRTGLLVLALLIGVGLVYLMPTSDPSAISDTAAQKKETPPPATQELAKYLPVVPQDEQTTKNIEQFFKTGFREYLNGNYLRAKPNFEAILQMQPSHVLAKNYLEKCDFELTSQVKIRLQHGKKAFGAGKLKEARGDFEAVLRLLYRDPSHVSYREAQDQLEQVNKAIRGEVK